MRREESQLDTITLCLQKLSFGKIYFCACVFLDLDSFNSLRCILFRNGSGIIIAKQARVEYDEAEE